MSKVLWFIGLFWLSLMGVCGICAVFQDVRKLLVRKKAQTVILCHLSKFVWVEDTVERRNNLMFCLSLCLLMPLDEVQEVAGTIPDAEMNKQNGAKVFLTLADTFDHDGKRWFKLKPEGQRRYVILKRFAEEMTT